MARKRIERVDPKKLGPNPFLQNFSIYARKVTENKDLLQVDKVGGTVTSIAGNLTVERKFMVEQTEFTKLFKISENRRCMASLSDRANSLFVWLMYTAKTTEDYIAVNVSRYRKEKNCSHSTYVRAVNDLADAGVIMPTRYQTVLWLNPVYFFCGNRLERYSENIVTI